ncbi:MAG: CoA transferase [Rhodanobacteraceae bacterium]
MEVQGPLAGIKILEIESIGPGPHATMLLADVGANVLRITRPGATRRWADNPGSIEDVGVRLRSISRALLAVTGCWSWSGRPTS